MTKAQLIDYRFITQGNENELVAAIATVGPISVTIDARTLPTTRFFKGGIFDGFNRNRNLKCTHKCL